MLVEIKNHLDKKYSVNYKMKLRDITPEEIEIIKDRTASPVVMQTKDQLIFAEEIIEVEFEDIIDPPKEIIPISSPTFLQKYLGWPRL